MSENNLIATEHKCLTCAKEVPICDAKNVIFGIDVDPSTAFTEEADKVVECRSYYKKLSYKNAVI